MATYYVAAIGTHGSGSFSNPWGIPDLLTGSAPVTQGVALTTLVAGDTLYFLGGTYNISGAAGTSIYDGNQLLSPIVSGTLSSPITLSAYPGDVVAIVATGGFQPIFGTSNPALSYISFRGFSVDPGPGEFVPGDSAFNAPSAFVIENSHNEVGYNTIIGRYMNVLDNHAGIAMESSSANWIHHNYIHGVQGNGHNSVGILIYTSSDLIVEDNYITGCFAGIFDKDSGNQNTYRRNYLVGNTNPDFLGNGQGSVALIYVYDNVYNNLDMSSFNNNCQIYNNLAMPSLANHSLLIGYSNESASYNAQIWNNVILTHGTAVWGYISGDPALLTHSPPPLAYMNFNVYDGAPSYGFDVDNTDTVYSLSGFQAQGFETQAHVDTDANIFSNLSTYTLQSAYLSAGRFGDMVGPRSSSPVGLANTNQPNSVAAILNVARYGAAAMPRMVPVVAADTFTFSVTSSERHITVSESVQIDALVTTSGKLLKFCANSATVQSNGNWLQATVTANTGMPTAKSNGKAIQLDAAPASAPAGITDPTCNFSMYRLQCGSVQTIDVVSAGSLSATSVTATWDGVSGGGSSLVLGPVGLATGLITYTIQTPGSGYSGSFYTQIPAIPGQNPAIPACVQVLVVGGIPQAVVPVCGHSMAFGVGFTGTAATGISLPGSAALNYSQAPNGSFLWRNTPIAGSGLVVSATIGKYPQVIPVVSSSSDFVGLPTITLTDSINGVLATCVPVMSGPSPTDVLVYSAPAGWLTASIAGVGGYLAPAATNAPVFNSVGQIEPTVGHSQGIAGQNTTGAGVNTGTNPTSLFVNVILTAKNKLKAASAWQPGFNCAANGITLDATHYPQFWTKNSFVTTLFYQNATAATTFGVSCPAAQGNWAMQYTDDFYSGVSAAVPDYKAFNTGGSQGISGSLVAGPSTTMPVLGAVTVTGGVVTAVAVTSGGSGLQAVFVTISGNGSHAVAVGRVVGGVLQGPLTILCGGSGYSAATATATPVAMVGGVVTIVHSFVVSPENAGGNLVLSLDMVCGADGPNGTGVQHGHNVWVFAPGNTADRTNPLAVDDVVVANMTHNGMGPGCLRFMDSFGGPSTQQMIDPSDMLNPNDFSWLNYCTWDAIPPQVTPNQPTWTGTTTAGSVTITGIADTSVLTVGSQIFGAGIPGILFNQAASRAEQSTIASIVDAHTITINNAAMLTGVQSLSMNPFPSGKVIFNFARPYITNVSNPNGYSSPPSGKLYSSGNWTTSGTDSFGPYLDISTLGPHAPNDNGQFLAYGSGSLSQGLVELRSNVPHGLKSGLVTGVFGGPYFSPVQSFSGTSVAGTPTITNATGAQFFPGQVVLGGGAPTSPFTKIISVSGTTLTLSANLTFNGSTVSFQARTAIPWLHAGTQPIGSNDLGLGDFTSYYYVTGPTTIVVTCSTPGSGGTANDVMAGTPELPIYLPFTSLVPNAALPYEYGFSFAKTWANTALWLNVPDVCSDAFLTDLGTKAGQIAPNQVYLFEVKDELFNGTNNPGEINWENQMAYLLKYVPSGTSLYPHYTNTGSVTSFVTSGVNTFLDLNSMHCLLSANKHYVFTRAFAAAGGNPANVKLIYGGQYGVPAQSAVNASKALNLPQHYIAIAPYYGTSQSASSVRSNRPAGLANAAWGNLPCDAMNDVTRHYMFYSSTLHKVFADQMSIFAGTTFRLLAYEGGAIYIAQGPPFTDQVQQDCFMHPSFANLSYTWYAAMANGDPAVANSGMVYSAAFSAYNPTSVGPLWKWADGAGQLASSNGNQFVTPQGGLPGTGNPHGYFQTNNSPGLQGFQEAIGNRGTSASSGVGAASTSIILSGVATASSDGHHPAASTNITFSGVATASSHGRPLVFSTLTLSGVATASSVSHRPLVFSEIAFADLGAASRTSPPLVSTILLTSLGSAFVIPAAFKLLQSNIPGWTIGLNTGPYTGSTNFVEVTTNPQNQLGVISWWRYELPGETFSITCRDFGARFPWAAMGCTNTSCVAKEWTFNKTQLVQTKGFQVTTQRTWLFSED